MGKTSASSKNRWNAKAYDRIGLMVPKGRKETLEQQAQLSGESVNGYLNRLVRQDIGLTEAEWKARPNPEE